MVKTWRQTGLNFWTNLSAAFNTSVAQEDYCGHKTYPRNELKTPTPVNT